MGYLLYDSETRKTVGIRRRKLELFALVQVEHQLKIKRVGGEGMQDRGRDNGQRGIQGWHDGHQRSL